MFLDKAASNFVVAGGGGLNRQFSETDAWGTIGFNTTTTDQALSNVVGQALQSYLTGQFGTVAAAQPYLGGRDTTDVPNHAVGTVNGGTAYNCTEMAKVWEAARCMDFNANPMQHVLPATPGVGADGFRDFFWLQANDPRNLPPGLTACTPPTTSYTTNLADAFNGNATMFVMAATDDKDPDGTPYTKDDVQTYLKLILPNGVTPATSCAPAIPTGISIHRTSGTTLDYICPNPGCSLIGGACN